MRDFLLIAAVAAAFAFGWLVMGKLGAFLEGIRHEEPASSKNTVLRIGFSDPLVADSLSGALAQYSNIHPDVSVFLFSGTSAALLKQSYTHKLDMIFLPENTSVPKRLLDHVEEVSLEHIPIMTQYGGLQIESISEGHIQQKLVWTEAATTSEASQLIQYLKGGNPIFGIRTVK